jgi:hypothetical protein
VNAVKFRRFGRSGPICFVGMKGDFLILSCLFFCRERQEVLPTNKKMTCGSGILPDKITRAPLNNTEEALAKGKIQGQGVGLKI